MVVGALPFTIGASTPNRSRVTAGVVADACTSSVVGMSCGKINAMRSNLHLLTDSCTAVVKSLGESRPKIKTWPASS